MERRLQAVYKDGVLQPLDALPLEDKQQVTMTITDSTTVGQDVTGYFSPEEWAEAAHDDISLDEVRRALSTISGSLSEAVVALRQER
jgi:predicted DNA-binding antitoxin AbrB/MazE fold protein